MSDEKILVWEMKGDGNSIYVDSLSDVAAMIENDWLETEEGSKMIITCVSMSRKKYETLPEFDGF